MRVRVDREATGRRRRKREIKKKRIYVEEKEGPRRNCERKKMNIEETFEKEVTKEKKEGLVHAERTGRQEGTESKEGTGRCRKDGYTKKERAREKEQVNKKKRAGEQRMKGRTMKERSNEKGIVGYKRIEGKIMNGEQRRDWWIEKERGN